MSILQSIRSKYNLSAGAKYEPNPQCKFCKGTGERAVPRTGKTTFCICLYASPDMSNEAGLMLGKVASEMLKNMKAPNPS